LRGNVDTLFPDLAAPVVDVEPHQASENGGRLGMAAATVATPLVAATSYAATSEMFIDDVGEAADDVSEPTEESLEFLDDETIDEVENDFVVLDDNDEKLGKTTDIYSTLELDEPLTASSPSETRSESGDWFTGPPEQVDEPEPDTAPLPWIDDEPNELLPEETNDIPESEFVIPDMNDEKPIKASDIYSTIAIEESVVASPEADLPPKTDDWFDGSPVIDSPPPETDVRYFRADDEPPAVIDAEAPPADEPPIGLYADPNTGELTWPTMSSDSESADVVEETYLLPEEATELDAATTVASELGETIDFDELELKPIEEDDPSMFYGDEGGEELFVIDPEQTIDFVEDDQEPDTKHD